MGDFTAILAQYMGQNAGTMAGGLGQSALQGVGTEAANLATQGASQGILGQLGSQLKQVGFKDIKGIGEFGIDAFSAYNQYKAGNKQMDMMDQNMRQSAEAFSRNKAREDRLRQMSI